jgi:hypothetical protein
MKLGFWVLFSSIALGGLLAQPASAGECTGNEWQPTFVRHDTIAPTVYYVVAAGAFVPMSSQQEAQSTCVAQGVREPITGQTCAQRNWGDFGCGCNITPSPNTTCAAFQSFLRTRGLLP